MISSPWPSRPIASLLGLCCVAGCASAGPGLFPGPDRVEARLEDAEIRAIAELLMLEDHRRYDAAAFERHAGSASAEVRRRAVTAAARIGDRAAVPLLLRALRADPDARVRADAAFGLGEMGDSSAAVVAALREAAPRSWVPVRDEDVPVVVEVLGALGKLGSPEAGRLVGDALLETQGAVNERGRRVAAEALLAAWRFGDAAPVPRIAAFLHSEDPEIRWRAAYALARSGSAEAVPYLLPRAADPDPRVRQYAVRALAQVSGGRIAGDRHTPLRDSALVALEAAVGDPHPHVRINALGALAAYGDDAPLELIHDRAREDAALHRNAAIAAVNALGRLGARATAVLAGIAGDPALDDPAVQGAALAQFAPLDTAAARAIAESWSTGSFQRRYHAARALAAMGWPSARDLVHRLAGDRDPRLAIPALEAAGAIARDSALPEPARTSLRTLLLDRTADEDPRVATVAMTALATVVTGAAFDHLLRAYARTAAAATPADRAAAIAAVETLAALDRKEPGAAAAFFRRQTAPTDRWIRRAVADTLGSGWGSPPAAAAADDAAFYAEIVRRYVAAPLEGRGRPAAVVRTASGTFGIELLSEEAPLTVASFVELATGGFYDDGVWHRVVPNFVLQDGAPAGFASGGPGRAIRDEINRVRYDRGAVGMALSGPDTGGSQWFITHSPQPHLDGGYTVFGRLADGMEVADGVVQGEPIVSIRIRQ